MEALEEKLGYRFTNRALLENALTHSSYANENKAKGLQSNERLEFLGDSVLGMVVADYLFRTHPDLPEGDLTRTRAALDRVRQQGVLVVPVTGRPSQGIPQAVLDLPGLRYAVSSNGATIRDLATGQVLLEKLLPAATCLEVLDRCAQVPMLREVFRAGVGYLSQGDYETLRARYAGTSMLQYHLDTRQVLPGTVAEFLQADPRPVEELFFLTGSPQEKAALRDLLTGIQGIGFADPFPNDLEVIAGDIDKGEALRFLLRHLGLEASQVLAMGDGGSDLPLLQAAGIGVAMANATEGVKAAADFVTTSCDEDGVAVALEKFVL